VPGRDLQAGGSVTLATVAGVVTGTLTIGPASQRDPRGWDVDTIIWKTSRPAAAPIPRIEVYKNDTSFANAQFVDYDGSFGNAGGTCRLEHNENLVVIWTGGTAGDVAQFSVTGTRS
jgi:hypothetical protein